MKGVGWEHMSDRPAAQKEFVRVGKQTTDNEDLSETSSGSIWDPGQA